MQSSNPKQKTGHLDKIKYSDKTKYSNKPEQSNKQIHFTIICHMFDHFGCKLCNQLMCPICINKKNIVLGSVNDQ